MIYPKSVVRDDDDDDMDIEDEEEEEESTTRTPASSQSGGMATMDALQTLVNGPHSKQAHARKLSEQKSKSISNTEKKLKSVTVKLVNRAKKSVTDFNFFVENQTKALAVLENEYDTDYKDLVKKRKTLDVKWNEYQQAYKKRKKVLDGKRNALVKEFGQEARVVVIKKKEQFEKYAANQENKRKTHVNKILALLADSL